MPDDKPEFYDPAEDGPWCSPREILARHGYAPLPPAKLDARQLPGRLWELLYAAAGRRFFFCRTNHLSDEELYVLLWERWLDEPTADIPPEAVPLALRVAADRMLPHLMQGADASLLQPPVNVLRLSLHPQGLAPNIANLAQWRAHIFERLRHQVQATFVVPTMLHRILEHPRFPSTDLSSLMSLSYGAAPMPLLNA